MFLSRKRLALLVIVVAGSGLLWRLQSLNTKLLHALRSSDTWEAETLLERGASANAEDQYGSALQEACRRGSISIVPSLLRHGASLSPPIAAHLLNSLSEVQDSQVTANPEGYQHVLALLLARGAKIDQRSLLGHTPLTMAAWQCNIEVCRLLINTGADVNAELENGLTAFGHAEGSAADWKYKQLVVLLRSKGARLSVKERHDLATRIPFALRYRF